MPILLREINDDRKKMGSATLFSPEHAHSTLELLKTTSHLFFISLTRAPAAGVEGETDQDEGGGHREDDSQDEGLQEDGEGHCIVVGGGASIEEGQVGLVLGREMEGGRLLSLKLVIRKQTD